MAEHPLPMETATAMDITTWAKETPHRRSQEGEPELIIPDYITPSPMHGSLVLMEFLRDEEGSMLGTLPGISTLSPAQAERYRMVNAKKDREASFDSGDWEWSPTMGVVEDQVAPDTTDMDTPSTVKTAVESETCPDIIEEEMEGVSEAVKEEDPELVQVEGWQLSELSSVDADSILVATVQGCTDELNKPGPKERLLNILIQLPSRAFLLGSDTGILEVLGRLKVETVEESNLLEQLKNTLPLQLTDIPWPSISTSELDVSEDTMEMLLTGERGKQALTEGQQDMMVSQLLNTKNWVINIKREEGSGDAVPQGDEYNQAPSPYDCKLCPRKVKPSQSELYRHLSQSHLSREISAVFGACPEEGQVCPLCPEWIKKKAWSSHLGQAHLVVEMLLDESLPGNRSIFSGSGENGYVAKKPHASTKPRVVWTPRSKSFL